MDKSPQLILASSSPRRRDLLRSAGVHFEIRPSDLPETMHDGERPEDYACRMASEKAGQVARTRRCSGDTRVVLGADTIVVIDAQTIGKPRDRQDARDMISLLSGRTHQVITGCCIIDGADAETCFAVTTDVTFRSLEPTEIERYLDRATWNDKAGAYAVQEHAAGMVASLQGSYTNVVGLPLAEVLVVLHEVGVVSS